MWYIILFVSSGNTSKKTLVNTAATFGVLCFLIAVAYLIASMILDSDTLVTIGCMLLSFAISVLLVLFLFLYYS